ncbi:MAG: hypothetical protein EXR27_07305 [Betaproteobacteria bacterium]|nr:hypothetical protein [Betaproteobacteria bacterium]
MRLLEHAVRWTLSAALAGLTGAHALAADAPPPQSDFELKLAPGDTLIGIGKRLLADPDRWPEVQRHNKITNVFRLPTNGILLIPIELLRGEPVELIVRGVSGQATRADGTPLAAGDRLAEGASIRTAERTNITLQLVDGSIFRLQPSSDLTVERARRIPGSEVTDSRFQMKSGRADVAFKPSSPKGSRFEIRTGFASAAVRGTEFRIAAADRVTRAEVEGGTIAFTGIRIAANLIPTQVESIAVPSGFGSVVDESGRPIGPVSLIGAPNLPQPRVIQFAPALQLRFPALASAVGYRVRLATDASFDNVLRESVETQPFFNLPDLPVGAYMLKVRAIDNLGLEGREASVPVRIVAGKPAAAPPPPAPAAAPAAEVPSGSPAGSPTGSPAGSPPAPSAAQPASPAAGSR